MESSIRNYFRFGGLDTDARDGESAPAPDVTRFSRLSNVSRRDGRLSSGPGSIAAIKTRFNRGVTLFSTPTANPVLCATHFFGRMWIGTDDGDVLYQDDGALNYAGTWTTLSMPTVTAVRAIQPFYGRLYVAGSGLGVDVWNPATGLVAAAFALPAGATVYNLCAYRGDLYAFTASGCFRVTMTSGDPTTATVTKMHGPGVCFGVVAPDEECLYAVSDDGVVGENGLWRLGRDGVWARIMVTSPAFDPDANTAQQHGCWHVDSIFIQHSQRVQRINPLTDSDFVVAVETDAILSGPALQSVASARGALWFACSWSNSGSPVAVFGAVFPAAPTGVGLSILTGVDGLAAPWDVSNASRFNAIVATSEGLYGVGVDAAATGAKVCAVPQSQPAAMAHEPSINAVVAVLRSDCTGIMTFTRYDLATGEWRDEATAAPPASEDDQFQAIQYAANTFFVVPTQPLRFIGADSPSTDIEVQPAVIPSNSPLVALDAIPTGRCGCAHQGRLWLGDLVDYIDPVAPPSLRTLTIRASAPINIEDYLVGARYLPASLWLLEDVITLYDEPDARVRALFSHSGSLYALTDFSLYRITQSQGGDSDVSAGGPNGSERIATGMGTRAKNSVVEAEGKVWWWSSRGPVCFDGSSVNVPSGSRRNETLLQRVRARYTGTNIASDTYVVARYNEAQREVWFWLIGSGACRPNLVVAINVDDEEIVVHEPRSGIAPERRLQAASAATVRASGQPETWVGDDLGLIRCVAMAPDDMGHPIDMRVSLIPSGARTSTQRINNGRVWVRSLRVGAAAPQLKVRAVSAGFEATTPWQSGSLDESTEEDGLMWTQTFALREDGGKGPSSALELQCRGDEARVTVDSLSVEVRGGRELQQGEPPR